MKQRTMKTLGVAVLGAAFAAASAGTASAVAPLGAGKTAGGTLKILPAQETARTLPAAHGKMGPAKSHRLNQDPVQQLLGGLPLVGGVLDGKSEQPKQPKRQPSGTVNSSALPGGLLG
ncbi:MAG TPA: ATP-binding protein [Streptomyces sp.]|nr:ATP-binding protein [Streptomyces sp.]